MGDSPGHMSYLTINILKVEILYFLYLINLNLY